MLWLLSTSPPQSPTAPAVSTAAAFWPTTTSSDASTSSAPSKIYRPRKLCREPSVSLFGKPSTLPNLDLLSFSRLLLTVFSVHRTLSCRRSFKIFEWFNYMVGINVVRICTLAPLAYSIYWVLFGVAFSKPSIYDWIVVKFFWVVFVKFVSLFSLSLSIALFLFY